MLVKRTQTISNLLNMNRKTCRVTSRSSFRWKRRQINRIARSCSLH